MRMDTWMGTEKTSLILSNKLSAGPRSFGKILDLEKFFYEFGC